MITAPSTFNAPVGGKDNIFTLVRVNDTLVEYRQTTADDVVVDSIGRQAVLAISIRRPTKQSNLYRYAMKYVLPLWDDSGDVPVRRGQVQFDSSWIVPNSPYYGDSFVAAIMASLSAGLITQSTVGETMTNLSFFR